MYDRSIVNAIAKRRYAGQLTVPPAVVFCVSLGAMELLSDRYRMFSGTWIAILFLIAVVLLIYIFVAENNRHAGRAYVATAVFVFYVTAVDVYGIAHLTKLLISGGEGVHGTRLLASSVYFWGSNVLAFGLCYLSLIHI